MIKQGIDLSRWNIVTSFKNVKDSGIDFVIIRIGGSNGGFYKDPKFELYYKAAKKAGYDKLIKIQQAAYDRYLNVINESK